ncbi:MAG: radical SAM protein [Candidatus Latescibacterota bacterium]
MGDIVSDVILVFPATGFDRPKVSIDLPLSLLAAANLVSREFSIRIIDQRLEPYWQDLLKQELKYNPLCVGVTAMTGPQIFYALEVAKIVKENSDVPLVWGGVHGTLQPDQTLQHPNVDIVVIGEGEYSFLELVRVLASKHQFSSVRGIAFKHKGRIVRTETPPTVDLERLPMLPYHLVDVERYIGSQGRFPDKKIRSLIFFSSRGCPFRCAYCCNPALYHSTWRSLSAERTFQQASELAIKFKLDAVTFHDEDLFISKHRIEKLADLIGGRFLWWGQSRMDRIAKMDLTKLERGGLRALQPGIESGSDRVLRMIHKGETVATVLKANRALARTGIVPLYNFMMGFPTETYDELMESVDLAAKLLDENPRAELTGFYVFIPYPGTELFKVAVKEGFRPPESLEGWSTFNRQRLFTPWMTSRPELYHAIMMMSKFVDRTRMIRRLRDHSDADLLGLFLLRQLARLYRYRWGRHEFEKSLENKLTSWVSNRLFHWEG